MLASEVLLQELKGLKEFCTLPTYIHSNFLNSPRKQKLSWEQMNQMCSYMGEEDLRRLEKFASLKGGNRGLKSTS